MSEDNSDVDISDRDTSCSLFFLKISDIVYLIEHLGTQSTATFIEMAYFDLWLKWMTT